MATYIVQATDINGDIYSPEVSAEGVVVGNLPITKTFQAVLPQAGWTENTGDGSYSQTVSCTGITADYIIWDWKAVSMNSPTVDAVIQECLGMIGKVTPGAGQVTVLCNAEKPTVDFTLAMRPIKSSATV